MFMNIKLDVGSYMPTRAHKTDAGLDLYSPIDTWIEPHNECEIDTGVHLELPKGTVGLVRSKSGLLFKYGILTDGTIDEGYTGSIKIKLFNMRDQLYDIKKGEKIAQLVIVKCKKPRLLLTDVLKDTDRGDDGFGSTGK